jgi:hypothetical protein
VAFIADPADPVALAVAFDSVFIADPVALAVAFIADPVALAVAFIADPVALAVTFIADPVALAVTFIADPVALAVSDGIEGMDGTVWAFAKTFEIATIPVIMNNIDKYHLLIIHF